jgi:hypothetical protein
VSVISRASVGCRSFSGMALSLVEPRPSYTTAGRSVQIPLAAPKRKRER